MLETSSQDAALRLPHLTEVSRAVVDDDTGERILELEVRGKRGVGFCKSMPGVVHPFLRLRKRSNPKQTAVVFGKPRGSCSMRCLRSLT
jgi:hypothetical protein